ncbi:hypothetical protein [Streptomyces virginiae]
MGAAEPATEPDNHTRMEPTPGRYEVRAASTRPDAGTAFQLVRLLPLP